MIAILLMAIYTLILLYGVIRILLDTRSAAKTFAYLLLVFLLPVVGLLFYFSVGINFRKRLPSSNIKRAFDKVTTDFHNQVKDISVECIKQGLPEIEPYIPLIHFINNSEKENLFPNAFHLLINGEEKFPDVLQALAGAKNHIHMEYYAWENDTRGNQVKEVLLKKAAEGVRVRVLYDAYASRSIRKNIVREMKVGGIEVYPVIRVKLAGMANRMNHRDHRKIIIIDGQTAYLGGINVSDRYDNSIETGLYWRDTHVRIIGPTVLNIQRHFIINWNVFTPRPLEVAPELFPAPSNFDDSTHKGLAQVVAGGPVFRMSNIMLTYAKLFNLARQKLYITNPYFIPSDSISDALKQAAKSGVDVRLLLPYKSDSAIVGAASRFYFQDLLEAGVKIFLYKKGFVHAKTVVADGMVSIVGTANMDIRSFDLNFEIMPVIYDPGFAAELEAAFVNDLEEAVEMTAEAWRRIPITRQLLYSIARLISAFL